MVNTEYEVRILEIDKDDVINRLKELNAKFVGEYFQKDMYIIQFLNMMENGLDLELMDVKLL